MGAKLDTHHPVPPHCGKSTGDCPLGLIGSAGLAVNASPKQYRLRAHRTNTAERGDIDFIPADCFKFGFDKVRRNSKLEWQRKTLIYSRSA